MTDFTPEAWDWIAYAATIVGLCIAVWGVSGKQAKRK